MSGYLTDDGNLTDSYTATCAITKRKGEEESRKIRMRVLLWIFRRFGKGAARKSLRFMGNMGWLKPFRLIRVCPNCGKPFVPKTSRRIWCSPNCRSSAVYRKMMQADPERYRAMNREAKRKKKAKQDETQKSISHPDHPLALSDNPDPISMGTD